MVGFGLAVACGGDTVSDTSGASGGAGSGASAAGGTSTIGGNGSGADMNASCKALESDYLDTLAAAKACNPVIAVEQCTLKMAGDLPCQCPTFVNPSNTDAIADLEALKQQYSAMGCDVGLPPCSCADPTSAGCMPNGSGADGICTDVF